MMVARGTFQATNFSGNSGENRFAWCDAAGLMQDWMWSVVPHCSHIPRTRLQFCNAVRATRGVGRGSIDGPGLPASLSEGLPLKTGEA
jgi:hypothetical protein